MSVWDYSASVVTAFLLLAIVLAVRYALKRNEELRIDVFGKHLIVVKRITTKASDGSIERKMVNRTSSSQVEKRDS